MYDFQQSADHVRQANNKSDLQDLGGILEHDKSKQSIQPNGILGEPFR